MDEGWGAVNGYRPQMDTGSGAVNRYRPETMYGYKCGLRDKVSE